MNFLQKVGDVILASLCVAASVSAFFLFLDALVKPFAPIFTLAVVLVLTISTMDRYSTAILSSVGLALYVASWDVANAYGIYPGIVVWLIGLITWSTGVCLAFRTSNKRA